MQKEEGIAVEGDLQSEHCDGDLAVMLNIIPELGAYLPL